MTTAISASMAGSLLSPYPLSHNIFPCIFISMGLYCLGMVSNDLLDFDKDLKHRPDRVLPSGLIDRHQAMLALLILVVSMTLMSLFCRPQQRFLYGLSAIFILLYNGPLKSQFWIGSICLGTARSLNFFGAYGPVQFGTFEILLYGVFLSHIVTVMTISQGEDRSEPVRKSAWFLWSIQVGLVFVACSIWAIPWIIWTGHHVWAHRNSDRNLRPKLVGLLVASLTILEACILASRHHFMVAIFFIVLFILGRQLRLKFPIG